jgi:hypothetical protein
MDDPAARRPYRALSPGEDLKFRIVQTKLEIAFRATGDPRALLRAFMHVWSAGQTLPRWLVPAIGEAIAKSQTKTEAERFRERLRDVQRYLCVRNLLRIPAANPGRRKTEYTKAQAVALAYGKLKGTPAFAARRTIRNSYDKVRRDLKRHGRRSVFYLYVGGGADPLIVDLTV